MGDVTRGMGFIRPFKPVAGDKWVLSDHRARERWEPRVAPVQRGGGSVLSGRNGISKLNFPVPSDGGWPDTDRGYD